MILINQYVRWLCQDYMEFSRSSEWTASDLSHIYSTSWSDGCIVSRGFTRY